MVNEGQYGRKSVKRITGLFRMYLERGRIFK